ncbi:Suppressor protein stp22 of temperature-sensitive alpha-factor receptor and arginine permease [Taxawa tesnikishii (nom. ined.)]|nr:Suppressor protein stp22 of temperature-sensitive alpha-factor receptor and arginine permease [Dothideales sp. JES 119]
MVEFLRILQDVFAKEPPVMAKQQQQYRQPTEQPAPPPKPSAPLQPVEMPTPDPPPKPRKRGEQVRDGTPAQGHERSFSRTGPPLPPLPHEQVPRGNPSPVSPLTPDGHAEPLDSRYQHPPPLPPSQLRQETRPIQNPQYHPPPTQPVAYQQQQRPVSIPQPYPAQTYPAQNYPPQQYQHQQAPQSHPQQVQKHPAPAPAPDLLTDPFDISLPVQSSAPAAPPPIPPNPQKEHLLSALSSTLVSQAHAQLQQNASALAPLRAQHAALQAAHSRLNAELSQLQSLSAALETNERILHRSLHDCDAVIESSKRTPAPDIDEVLVAPTVVAQQLWNLQAEEAGLREALWCLQRAVGAGRVSGEVFVRLTRSLARELWLKMALARKVARGWDWRWEKRGGWAKGCIRGRSRAMKVRDVKRPIETK